MKRILLLSLICITLLCGCKNRNLPEPGRYEEPFPEELLPNGESIDIDGIVTYSNETIGKYLSEWIPIAVNEGFTNCRDDFEYPQVVVHYRQITGPGWNFDTRSILCSVIFNFQEHKITVFVDEKRERMSTIIPINQATTSSWKQARDLLLNNITNLNIEECEFDLSQSQTGWEIPYYPYHRHFEINTETQEIVEILD